KKNFTFTHGSAIPLGQVISATATDPFGNTSEISSCVAVTCVAPATPVASSTGPICIGQPLALTATTIAGAAYSWTGPNGFTSSQQNPVILSPTPASAG